MARLSQAQRRVLENLAAGRRPNDGFALGRSTAGGLSGTRVSLFVRGFIDENYRITPSGRAALAKEAAR